MQQRGRPTDADLRELVEGLAGQAEAPPLPELPDDLPTFSDPAKAVERFLRPWKTSRWTPNVEGAIQRTWAAEARARGRNPVELCRRKFAPLKLIQYSIGEPEEVSAFDPELLLDVPVKLAIRRMGGTTKVRAHDFTARVICESGPYAPRTVDDGGSWGVSPGSVAPARKNARRRAQKVRRG